MKTIEADNQMVEVTLEPLKTKHSLSINLKKEGKKVSYHSVKRYLTTQQQENLDLAFRVKRVWDNRADQFGNMVRLKMEAKKSLPLETMLECFVKKQFTIL